MRRDHPLVNLLRLPPRRWVDLAIAAVLAVRIERALQAGGLDRAAAISGIRVGMNGSAADVGMVADIAMTAREKEKLDTAWRMLRKPPFNGTCLRRALVGGALLRDRHPVLRIGVTKVAGQVSAHAWLEIDGVSLDPDGAGRYAVLAKPGEPS